jgi:hypothetical protein
MYWHGRLVIPTFQRFYSSQQVAQYEKFPLVLLQAKVVGLVEITLTVLSQIEFPLVLLQAKVVGARFLNLDTAILSDPQIYAPL